MRENSKIRLQAYEKKWGYLRMVGSSWKSVHECLSCVIKQRPEEDDWILGLVIVELSKVLIWTQIIEILLEIQLLKDYSCLTGCF